MYASNHTTQRFFIVYETFPQQGKEGVKKKAFCFKKHLIAPSECLKQTHTHEQNATIRILR
jgi:hypothetical protein